MDDFVVATSVNLPMVDALALAEFLSGSDLYSSAEIRNFKIERSMRPSYVSSAVGKVALKRIGEMCTVKAEVCPEHRQGTKNYNVTMTVDESREAIMELKCHDCAASLGGCKHALALATWVHTKSVAPAPTEVVSYWKKPRLTNIASSAVTTAEDFGRVVSSIEPNVSRFLSCVDSAPSSIFKRYRLDLEEISSLDLHQIMLKYREASVAPYTAQGFRAFSAGMMPTSLCKTACKKTESQSASRHWHFLRYARISASRLYGASHSKKEGGGVLKEQIFGASKIKCTQPMRRGLELEDHIIQVVARRKKIRIEKVGIMLSSELPEFAATPDGVSRDFVVEVKCPSSEKSLRRYVTNSGAITSRFMAQVLLQMKFFDKKKGLFCVASPCFEEDKNVNILEIEYDEATLNELVFSSEELLGRTRIPYLTFLPGIIYFLYINSFLFSFFKMYFNTNHVQNSIYYFYT